MKKMNESKKELSILGYRYLKIPRSLLSFLYSNDPNKRQKQMFHLTLFTLCAYTDRTVRINGQDFHCRSGELITSCRHLSQLTGISRGSISRLMEQLEAEKLIKVEHYRKGSRIYVCGYNEFCQTTTIASSPVKTLAQEMVEYEEKLRSGRY